VQCGTRRHRGRVNGVVTWCHAPYRRRGGLSIDRVVIVACA
jgi:hypothetical protein